MTSTANPAQISSPSASSNVQAGTCPFCGSPLHNPDACDRCDWVRHHEARDAELRGRPRDTFAAVLSIIWPGAGHFYKGYKTLPAVLAGGGLLCFLWSVTFLMFFGFLIIPVYWGAVAAHAFFAKDLKYPAAHAG